MCLLSVLRKKRPCWAFFIMWGCSQSSPGPLTCAGRETKFRTHFTSSPMILRSVCSLVLIFLKSMMISFRLFGVEVEVVLAAPRNSRNYK